MTIDARMIDVITDGAVSRPASARCGRWLIAFPGARHERVDAVSTAGLLAHPTAGLRVTPCPRPPMHVEHQLGVGYL
jgi:hypothetical protein